MEANSTTRERATPPAAMEAAVARLVALVPPMSATQGPVAPSAAPGPGVVRVLTLVPSNAMVTLDTALAEKIMDFIIQPCDRRERGGKQLVTIIAGLFSQLLSVGPFL